MYAIDQITQYKRLQADIGGLTTLYAIIKAEKNKEKEPKPRVRFRFLLAEKEGFERSEPVSDGIARADRERCGMNMPRRTSVTRSVADARSGGGESITQIEF